MERVNPKYTGQTCKCGHREKANRNGIYFRCKKCGYTNHVDSNGAINIAKAISGLSAGVPVIPRALSLVAGMSPMWVHVASGAETFGTG